MNKINFSEINNELKKNGVVLTKNFFSKSEIDLLRLEYDFLDQNCSNREIFKNKPVVVLWNHVLGEQKRIASFDDFPQMWNLIRTKISGFVKEITGKKKLQLLETIIFNKPFERSNVLHWHQDVAYFPLKPNNQVAVWFPLEPVNEKRGALVYALKSHLEGIKGSTDLHTRKPFKDENRDLIPEDPIKAGYEVKCMEMSNLDILLHDGHTWHYSGPNKEKDYTRRGVSVRFIIEESVFDPRPGQGAAFTKQIDLKAGDKFEGAPFPYI
jgi:ectoine hydroxylase-related dioxygenase (phytanoyl-CoA dioxygenase family)